MSPILILILSSILGYITYYLYNFYSRLKLYPNGPTPVPILGNILMFKGDITHPYESFLKLIPKYGTTFTFWVGSKPFIFISDLEFAKQCFNKLELTGRPESPLGDGLRSDGGYDVLFSNYVLSDNQIWHTLRSASLSAVRKFAASHELTDIVAQCIDKTVDEIFKKEGTGKPFDPRKYIETSISRIITAIALGKVYDLDDPEFLYINSLRKDIMDIEAKFDLVQLIPLMRIPLYRYMKRFNDVLMDYLRFIRRKYDEHNNTFNGDSIRDVADALIAAKVEAISENKNSEKYLTDKNLSRALWDVFGAGFDSTNYTTQWVILLLGNYPEMQQKIRQEINDKIGDRIPTQDDMNECHYIMAFISECLRFKYGGPFGLPHKALTDTTINNVKIPANTRVVIFIYSIMNDPKYWTDPDVFKPERFIQDGQYGKIRNNAFIPFGIGRRKCLGEKLALADLFLTLVRYLQAISNYEIALPGGPGSADLTVNPNSICIFAFPKPYEIILKEIN